MTDRDVNMLHPTCSYSLQVMWLQWMLAKAHDQYQVQEACLSSRAVCYLAVLKVESGASWQAHRLPCGEQPYACLAVRLLPRAPDVQSIAPLITMNGRQGAKAVVYLPPKVPCRTRTRPLPILTFPCRRGAWSARSAAPRWRSGPAAAARPQPPGREAGRRGQGAGAGGPA